MNRLLFKDLANCSDDLVEFYSNLISGNLLYYDEEPIKSMETSIISEMIKNNKSIEHYKDYYNHIYKSAVRDGSLDIIKYFDNNKLCTLDDCIIINTLLDNFYDMHNCKKMFNHFSDLLIENINTVAEKFRVIQDIDKIKVIYVATKFNEQIFKYFSPMVVEQIKKNTERKRDAYIKSITVKGPVS